MATLAKRANWSLPSPVGVGRFSRRWLRLEALISPRPPAARGRRCDTSVRLAPAEAASDGTPTHLADRAGSAEPCGTSPGPGPPPARLAEAAAPSRSLPHSACSSEIVWLRSSSASSSSSHRRRSSSCSLPGGRTGEGRGVWGLNKLPSGRGCVNGKPQEGGLCERAVSHADCGLARLSTTSQKWVVSRAWREGCGESVRSKDVWREAAPRLA